MARLVPQQNDNPGYNKGSREPQTLPSCEIEPEPRPHLSYDLMAVFDSLGGAYVAAEGRLIAIGDIHGCSDALDAVLAAMDPQPNDTIVTLGDYVDRGRDSKGVIDRLIALSSRCHLKALQGNHEEMMLAVVTEKQPPFRWLQFGGVETLDSYGFCGDMSVIPASHFQFFDAMLDFYETDRFFFVHANYNPRLPLEKQTVNSLRWQKLTEVVPAPHMSGKVAVVGHTHDKGGEIFNVGHLICLDTYCYGGGWLTAMDLHSGKIWQADESGRMRG